MPDQSQNVPSSSEEQSSNNDDNVSESGNGLRHSQHTIRPPARYLPDNDWLVFTRREGILYCVDMLYHIL